MILDYIEERRDSESDQDMKGIHTQKPKEMEHLHPFQLLINSSLHHIQATISPTKVSLPTSTTNKTN
jgi:hypothetical protein